jgi:intein/homing endonuclease
MKSHIHKINLLETLPNNTKIKLDENIKSYLFNALKKEYPTLKELGQHIKINSYNIGRYSSGTRAIPLMTFIKLLKISELNLNDFQNKIKIKLSSTGKYLKIGPFLDIDEKWIYISELIRGDGHITKNMWSIQFLNKENHLIETVKNFFLDIGLPKKRITLMNTNNCNHLVIRSMLLAYILKNIFNINPGKRKDENIPDFIKENEKFTISAIRGFFDAEGSVYISKNKFKRTRSVRLSSISLNYIKNIKSMLKRLDISTNLYTEKRKNNDIYRLVLRGRKNIMKFKHTIKPNHPKRYKLLNILLNSYTRFSFQS